jgi:hypothetical protein
MTLLSWFNIPPVFGEDDLILELGRAGSASYSFPLSSRQVSLPGFSIHKHVLLQDYILASSFTPPPPVIYVYELWLLDLIGVLFPILVVQASQGLNHFGPIVAPSLLYIVIEGAARPPAYVLHLLSAHAFPCQNCNNPWPKTSGSQV